jgi:protein arginine N-methyltransferase 1
MIADHVRMDAYAQALRRAVIPGSAVVDIGTGTGGFAVLACRYGARRVYAIEPDDAIEIARETAAANGCADRIEFIQELSTKVTLPERVDVMLSDLRGVLPLFGRHVPSITDARERMLTPGGTLIPQRDTLWAAVVSAPDIYDRHTKPWGSDAFGLDMEPSRRLVTNTWSKRRFSPEQILLPPQPWATLDYMRIIEPDVCGEIAWSVGRPGIAHGLAVWFDALLAEGIGFSNAPGEPEVIYGNAFFPWPEPVGLDAGDTVGVTLHADLVGEDYVWRWDTRVLDHGRHDCSKANFRQSTFFGVPLSPRRMRALSPVHVPILGQDGQIDRFVLSQMDGTRSLETIAKDVAARFSERFSDWREALAHVCELSQRYGDD